MLTRYPGPTGRGPQLLFIGCCFVLLRGRELRVCQLFIAGTAVKYVLRQILFALVQCGRHNDKAVQ